MRKNKKLLLGGLSVLTLVAAGSGAVSTFAWFQVTNTATTAYSDVSGSRTATVDNTTHDATSTEFTIDTAVEAVNWSGRNDVAEANDHASANATAKMELMDYLKVNTTTWLADNSGTAGIYFGYYKSGMAAVNYQTGQFSNPKQDYWKIYKVTVSISAQKGFTIPEIVSALSSKKYDLTISRDTANGNVSIARFYAPTVANVLKHDSDRPEPTSRGATSLELGLTSTTGNAFAASSEYYFGLFVSGDDHTKNLETENGNFVVTIADHTA